MRLFSEHRALLDRKTPKQPAGMIHILVNLKLNLRRNGPYYAYFI